MVVAAATHLLICITLPFCLTDSLTAHFLLLALLTVHLWFSCVCIPPQATTALLVPLSLPLLRGDSHLDTPQAERLEISVELVRQFAVSSCCVEILAELVNCFLSFSIFFLVAASFIWSSLSNSVRPIEGLVARGLPIGMKVSVGNRNDLICC